MSSLTSAILERALKTFVQVLLATVSVDQFDMFSMSFVNALQLAASAAVLSVLTSLASMRFGQHGPSLTSESIEPTTVGGH